MDLRLRALKSILAPAPSRALSSSPKIPYPTVVPSKSKDLKMSEYVNTHSDGYSRTIELNRPAALNSLNYDMVRAITEAIKTWERTEGCNVICLTGTPSLKGRPTFCAGGDVVAMVKAKEDIEGKHRFFQTEYALNHLIGTCRKPIVSFIDGITMGGGAGISVHGRFRVATENTVFAMPETAIGFFPDVGGSFFLSRLGPLGVYLGLTGKRLTGSDVWHARLATHFIPANRLGDVKASLASDRHSVQAISSILDSFQGESQPFSLTPLLPAINECFGKYEVYEICEALRSKLSGGPLVVAQWAQESLETLTTVSSPTALCITLEMLKRAKTMSLGGCLQMEYQLVQQFFGGAVPDFVEGVTAKLIEKTGRPEWKPASIKDVPRSLIDDIFRNRLNGAVALTFHNKVDYMDYPRIA